MNMTSTTFKRTPKHPSQSKMLTSNPLRNKPTNNQNQKKTDKEKTTLNRKADHLKSYSNLSISRMAQSFVRERQVDKFQIPQNKYEFIAFQMSNLTKGLKFILKHQQVVLSKVLLHQNMVEVERNQIKHIFEIQRNSNAKYLKILLNALQENKLSISIESTLGKFKQSSIKTQSLEGEIILLNPFQMILEAEQIRKRKVSESCSKSALKIRPSLKIQDIKKISKFVTSPAPNKPQSISSSQIVFTGSDSSKTNIPGKQLQTSKKSLHLKTDQKQIDCAKIGLKTQKSTNNFKRFHTNTDLNLSSSSISTQPIIYECLSTKNSLKPSNSKNPLLFKRKVKPSTYSQIAQSKITFSTSRIQ